MKIVNASHLDAAERFVWTSARVLERLRFAHLFRDGDPQRVVTALRAYANPDGGFGEALEPDFRGPVSQPVTTEQALHLLHEVDAFDDPLVLAACDYLMTITTPTGGVPMMLADVPDYPHAPWWEPRGGEPAASLLPTAGIAGLCQAHGVDHPWVKTATTFCWDAIDRLIDEGPGETSTIQLAYDCLNVVTFLDHVGDRARAQAAAVGLGDLLLRAGAIELDPGSTDEVMMPLDYAAHPDSVARGWFTESVIETHLDALADAQADDGGWQVPWQFWAPATEFEWRPIQTIERLKTLRAYGRIEA